MVYFAAVVPVFGFLDGSRFMSLANFCAVVLGISFKIPTILYFRSSKSYSPCNQRGLRTLTTNEKLKLIEGC